MKFEFPDVADFPENVAPRLEGPFPLPMHAPTVEAFVQHVDEDVAHISGFGSREKEIQKMCSKRVIAASKLYSQLREPSEQSAIFETGMIHDTRDTDHLLDLVYDDLRGLLNEDDKDDLPIDAIDHAVMRKDRDLLAAVTGFLGDMLGECAAYYGRPYAVDSVTVHVSKPTDRHHYQQFRDCDTVTRLLNLHVDPKPGVMKAIIYLGDVDEFNGPFQTIPGSNQWERDELQQIYAWGNSIGNYCHTPVHRHVANAYPSALRRNAVIGRLIPDDSEMGEFLWENLESWTSDKGNVFVFDPCMMLHRGGLCQTGVRCNLQVRLR